MVASSFSILLIVVAAIVLTATTAQSAELPGSQDTARPCRPTISCNADITSPGTLEAEAGALASKPDHHTHALAFPFLLKQTFAPFLQMQLGSNGYSTTTSSPPSRYLDNIFVGPKVHLRDQGSIVPALGIGGQWSFPTFKGTGYARNHDLFFTGYASKDVSVIHFDLNVGANVYRLEDPHTQVFAAFAVSASVPSTPFGLGLEGYAFSNACATFASACLVSHKAAPLATHDAGIRSFVALSPRPWWVFDVGGDVGVLASARAYSLFVGMTIIPAIFFRPAINSPR